MNSIYKKFLLLILVLGILTELQYLLFAFLNGIHGDIPLYMIIYAETFLIFFVAYFIVKKYSSLTNDFGENNKLLKRLCKIFFLKDLPAASYKLPFLIILFGIIFRLTLLPTVPTTSPDVYRYIWEGKEIYHGFNPYKYPPNSPTLASINNHNLLDKVTFKDLTSIYPPFAQVLFTFGYFISGENAIGIKFIYLICEFFTMLFILKLLSAEKKNLNLVILYAWLPLPIMEFFVNAHIDPLGITFLVMFLYYIEKEKYFLSSVSLALSFLAKLYPAVLIPLLLKKIKFKKTFYFTLIFSAVVIIFYIPFVWGNVYVFSMLSNYIENWEFNGSIYHLMKLILVYGNHAHIVCNILLIATIIIISISYKNFINAVGGILLSVIIFTATVYPWYLGWIAALNPFLEFYSVLSLFFTINLTNLTPLAPVWREFTWVILTEYVIFFLFLVLDYLKLRKKNSYAVMKK